MNGSPRVPCTSALAAAVMRATSLVYGSSAVDVVDAFVCAIVDVGVGVNVGVIVVVVVVVVVVAVAVVVVVVVVVVVDFAPGVVGFVVVAGLAAEL